MLPTPGMTSSEISTFPGRAGAGLHRLPAAAAGPAGAEHRFRGDEVYYKGESIIIERKGKPLAKLAPLSTHEPTPESAITPKQRRLIDELNGLPTFEIKEEPTFAPPQINLQTNRRFPQPPFRLHKMRRGNHQALSFACHSNDQYQCE